MEREKRIDRVQVQYSRCSRIGKQNLGLPNVKYVFWNHREEIFIDRKSETIRLCSYLEAGNRVTREFHVEELVPEMLDKLTVLDRAGRFQVTEEKKQPPKGEKREYKIVLGYEDGEQKVLTGIFDRLGIPEIWEGISEYLREFIRYYEEMEMFNPAVYEVGRKRTGEYIYCSVAFTELGDTYYYLTDDESLKIGDFVVVPAGRKNEEKTVCIQDIEYFQREEVPFPLEKTKKILRRAVMHPVSDPRQVGWLLEESQDTLVWSCLEGTMGCIYADSREEPKTAAALLGDFCFLYGEAREEAVKFLFQESKKQELIMVPHSREWELCIEQAFPGCAERFTRYATIKEWGVWDDKKLEQIVSGLPQGYQIRMIDEEIYDYSIRHDWCRDWVGQYADYTDYRENGIGVVVTRDRVPVAGASSYSYFSEGIEVEIDTHRDYRRRGLGLICGAKLILECEKRGLYPSWDAHNTASLSLAQKLGYRLDHPYTSYLVFADQE